MEESGFNLRQLFEEHRAAFILALLGLFLVSVGVFSLVVISLRQAKPQIEVIPASDSKQEEPSEIMIDVSGAVENPGIYRLPSKSRVYDALVAAGGLSVSADRSWVSRNINLAQSISDGIKIYIPTVEELAQPKGQISPLEIGSVGGVIGLETQRKVNINAAPVAELDALWGVGEKRAQAIIDNRPYTVIEQLLEKRVIPTNVFERIKDQISVN